MKVAVDPDRCQGHARCWEICPEVFSLDEVGHSVVTSGDVPSALEAEVTKAAANCPERAITVSLAQPEPPLPAPSPPPGTSAVAL
jgi:ferredoxin